MSLAYAVLSNQVVPVSCMTNLELYDEVYQSQQNLIRFVVAVREEGDYLAYAQWALAAMEQVYCLAITPTLISRLDKQLDQLEHLRNFLEIISLEVSEQQFTCWAMKAIYGE